MRSLQRPGWDGDDFESTTELNQPAGGLQV